MTEYVTMDLLLPLAGGLAGAALYHLLGPMLRGCIAIARFASFLCGWAIEAASRRENARAFAWDVVYGKEPASQPFDRLRSVESELIGLACHAAKVNVSLDALEERMGKVEDRDRDNLMAYHENTVKLYERVNALEDAANTKTTRYRIVSFDGSGDDGDIVTLAPADGSCYNTPEQEKAVPYGSQVPEKVPQVTAHHSSACGLPDWIEYCGTKYYAR